MFAVYIRMCAIYIRVPWLIHMCQDLFTLDVTHCSTLRHTAAHCSTLQHTASHCGTLRHTAAHCSTPQHTAAHRSTLQHTAAHYSTLQHTATHISPSAYRVQTRGCEKRQHCNTLQHPATHCNTLQHTPLLSAYRVQTKGCEKWQHFNTLQHTVTHCNTLQHTAAHCNTHTATHTSSFRISGTNKSVTTSPTPAKTAQTPNVAPSPYTRAVGANAEAPTMAPVQIYRVWESRIPVVWAQMWRTDVGCQIFFLVLYLTMGWQSGCANVYVRWVQTRRAGKRLISSGVQGIPLKIGIGMCLNTCNINNLIFVYIWKGIP